MQPLNAPQTFYLPGDLYPIEMTYLCEYPYQTPGVYAIYLNAQTKQPQRVYLPSIRAELLSRELVFKGILKTAQEREASIRKTMQEEGLLK